jgi:predicted DNA-binding antitoxin AbrB/MazE fold protein
MQAPRAHVENGAIVVDEPLNLPEGTEVKIVAIGLGDFSDEERAEITAALDEAADDIDAGREYSEEQVWASLKKIK